MTSLKRRVFIFIGTTAELIKLAPLIQELNKRKVKFIVIASRQNDIRFDEFLPLIGTLDIIYAVTPKSADPSIIQFAWWGIRTFFSLLIGLKSLFKGLNKSNSYFIVHGDTVSSLMGSLVAKIYGLTLVHIESGLRSFHFFEPFPEELCRYFISLMADIHFCPNQWCVSNLKDVRGQKVNTKQNTLIEAFWTAIQTDSNNPIVEDIQRKSKPYYVLVVHRQEHIFFAIKKMQKILSYIFSLIHKNITCVFLMHDQSSRFITALDLIIPSETKEKMIKIGRLPYGDFMKLLQGSEFVITDGGSNQEELYYMGKPCLLLRKYTERIEGLNENVLLSENNRSKITRFINSYYTYNRPSIKNYIKPSGIIVDYLFNHEIS